MKAITAFALASVFVARCCYADLPKGEDFPDRMPITTYVARSMASDVDLDAMALKYFESAGNPNPFTAIKGKRVQAVRDTLTNAIWNGDYLGAATGSPSSLDLYRDSQFKASEAEKIDKTSLARILGAEPAMDAWLPSYMTRFPAAVVAGGRVMPTWPDNVNPLYGSLVVKDGNSNRYLWTLNTKSPEYAEFVARRETGVTGGVDISNFPWLVSKFGGKKVIANSDGEREVEGDGDRGLAFMVKTVYADFVTQFINLHFFAPKEMSKFDLFAGLQQEDSITLGMTEFIHKLPADVSYKAEWAQSVMYQFSKMKNVEKAFDWLEKVANEAAYIALSEKGQPIKFMYRPLIQPNLRWTLVEFTSNGIKTTTLRNERRSFPVLTSLPTSPHDCQQFTTNKCLDYRMGNFDQDRALGVKQDVLLSQKQTSQTPDVFDAEEGVTAGRTLKRWD